MKTIFKIDHINKINKKEVLKSLNQNNYVLLRN